MYTIKVHKRIEQMMSFFYFIRFWNDDNRSNFCKRVLNITYLSVYGFTPVLLFAGAFKNYDEIEPIFSIVLSLVTFVGAIKMYYFLWNKDQILAFIREMGTHSISDKKEFDQVNNKIENLMKFGSCFVSMILCAAIGMITIALPIFSNKKHLPTNFYIPLNWKENEFVYWMSFGFVSYQILFSVVCASFNVIIWYMMVSCAVKYQILGNEFRNLGTLNEAKTTKDKKQNLFPNELIALIKNHRNLQQYKNFRNLAKFITLDIFFFFVPEQPIY